jgi:hypothetical protein
MKTQMLDREAVELVKVTQMKRWKVIGSLQNNCGKDDQQCMELTLIEATFAKNNAVQFVPAANLIQMK